MEQYQISGGTAADIATSVETGVRSGCFAPGESLPPIRRLAVDLAVSPATVAVAYRSLRQRGVVETAGRHGTRIRHRPPVAVRPSSRLPPGVLDLSSGEPDTALLPPLRQALARVDPTPGGYSGGGPLPRLLEMAEHRLAREHVVGNITVTGGALDGIDRTLAAHLGAGDAVGVEDPTWPNLRDLVAAHGLHPVPMPVDDDGPTTEGLEGALAAGVGAVIVTSRAQNPTGAVITAQRAVRLRETLMRHREVLVIEDDHWGELATDRLHPVVATTDRWIFLRSVSKPYGPDLRLAVAVGDEATIARLEGRMRIGAGWVSTILQQTVAALMDDPDTNAVIRNASRRYADKQRALIAALADHGVPAHGRSGLNVWIPVADEITVVTTLRDHGYAVTPGTHFRRDSPPAIRITVATLPDDQIERIAGIVASVPASAPRVV